MGFEIIEVGDWRHPYFTAGDWLPDSFIATRPGVALLALIHARHPGTGAFRRLLHSLERAGFTVLIECPLPHMEAVLTHYGFEPFLDGHLWARENPHDCAHLVHP